MWLPATRVLVWLLHKYRLNTQLQTLTSVVSYCICTWYLASSQDTCATHWKTLCTASDLPIVGVSYPMGGSNACIIYCALPAVLGVITTCNVVQRHSAMFPYHFILTKTNASVSIEGGVRANGGKSHPWWHVPYTSNKHRSVINSTSDVLCDGCCERLGPFLYEGPGAVQIFRLSWLFQPRHWQGSRQIWVMTLKRVIELMSCQRSQFQGSSLGAVELENTVRDATYIIPNVSKIYNPHPSHVKIVTKTSFWVHAGSWEERNNIRVVTCMYMCVCQRPRSHNNARSKQIRTSIQQDCFTSMI